jgi:hypothetical protein
MNELDKLAGNMNDDDRDGMDDKEIGKNIFFSCWSSQGPFK